MNNSEIKKLKEKIEDLVCNYIAEDIDDYEYIMKKLTKMMVKNYTPELSTNATT